MKVHTSNYRVVGFTEEVPPEELARLGRDKGVTSGWDLGSGRIEAEGARSLEIVGDETVVKEAVASGVDVVAFSGDKLLGGPQAGLIVGRRAAIRALRKNPIYRALRLDKVALSGLEATLELLLAGRGDELPARKHMHLTREELRPVAARIASTITALDGFEADVVDSSPSPAAGARRRCSCPRWPYGCAGTAAARTVSPTSCVPGSRPSTCASTTGASCSIRGRCSTGTRRACSRPSGLSPLHEPGRPRAVGRPDSPWRELTRRLRSR